MSEPTTAAGRKMLGVLDSLMAVLHGIATADLPENIAAHAKTTDQVKEELAALVLAIEAEAAALAATPAPLDALCGAVLTCALPILHDGDHERADGIRWTWPATPAPLDEGRLARVMRGMCDCIRSDEDAAVWARDIATGYAVLQRIEAPDEGNEWQERNE